MQKFKAVDLRGVSIHNERLSSNSSNKDIDYTRTQLNYDALSDLRSQDKVNYREAVENVLKRKCGADKAIRKDAVRLVSVLVSSDNDFFKELSREQQQQFFKAAAHYLSEKFGSDNVIAAKVHMDETTPHMHFTFVPVTTDGRLCAKEIINRQQLKQVQEELPKALQQAGFNIERGIENSPAKHLTEKKFKALTNLRRLSIKELNSIINSWGNSVEIGRAGLFDGTKIAKMPVETYEQFMRLAKDAVQLKAENEKLMRYYAPAMQKDYEQKLENQKQTAAVEKAALVSKYQKPAQEYKNLISRYVALQREMKELRADYQSLCRAIPVMQREKILQKAKNSGLER